jgi:hypothetical protein
MSINLYPFLSNATGIIIKKSKKNSYSYIYTYSFFINIEFVELCLL